MKMCRMHFQSLRDGKLTYDFPPPKMLAMELMISNDFHYVLTYPDTRFLFYKKPVYKKLGATRLQH